MNFGKYKTWYARGTAYIGVATFAMMVYNTVHINPDLIWYLPVGLFGLLAFLVYDIKVVMPQEMDYNQEKTPLFMELVRDVREIKKTLQENTSESI